MRPAEAGNIDRNEFSNGDAMTACARLIGVAIVDAEDVLMAFAYRDFAATLTATILLARSDRTAEVDRRRIVIA